MVRRCILVAIGANLPGPNGQASLATCEWAVTRMARLPGLGLWARSRWYRTTSVPPGQPDYVNGAVALMGDAEPHALLCSLHAIEAEAGRVRTEHWGPRTLDLDLVAMDDLVVSDPALLLPHPRMHERAFVLAPVHDVAPGWVHPVLRRTAASLLADCADAGAAKALPGAAEVPMSHLHARIHDSGG